MGNTAQSLCGVAYEKFFRKISSCIKSEKLK